MLAPSSLEYAWFQAFVRAMTIYLTLPVKCWSGLNDVGFLNIYCK